MFVYVFLCVRVCVKPGLFSVEGPVKNGVYTCDGSVC